MRTEGSLAKLRCQDGYMDITEDSRAKLGCSMYPSIDLDPSVMSMYLTGHPSWAL
jgi:hypothetical protein